ncbi:MAG TPA: carboxypeptidase-like regulatory domain-containing protein [Chitinophagaceae bacterium]|nr:carboxypeptidase-like regulatory domain-containing protein [Chitinophagaceae bacterium]
MVKTFRFHIILLVFLSTIVALNAAAQYKVQGTVFDSSHVYPLEAVTVMATNGNGTITNANGHYSIEVGERDSIWFSYLGKPTMKFAVIKMSDVMQFNIALQVNIPVLREVTIRQRNFKEDSAQNRRDYQKVFDFQKPNLGTMTSIGPGGAGVDINELIRTFQFRKNRNMQRFQDRLVQQEKEKYVDHRFNKGLVRRLTNLTGEELDKFMNAYRPTYEFTLYSSDYDFQAFIKESFKIYANQKSF